MPQAPKNKPHTALTPYSIGMKLKTLRTEKGLTLSRLGAEVGLSTALLSKLESEFMIPTLPTLAKIAHAYGVDLAFFFSTVQRHSLAITRKAHISADRRDLPRAREMPLHHSTPISRQVSRIVEIPANASCNIGNPNVRTELTACVLEGTLHLTSAGTEEVLHSGDILVLDTDSAVTWSAPETGCRVLAVFARTRLDQAANS
jgi:transcriptional regulator with XRE-family HTH domain